MCVINRNFGGTAILGFISTLLIAGKFIHYIFQRRGLVFNLFIIPPAIISGIVGLLWFSIIEFFDPLMTSDLRSGLESLKANLINFVFAALILGLTCSRTNSQHSSIRAMAMSLLHEGMPMIIYSQILMWGQSTCCLFAVCLANLCGGNIPVLFPAMIPLAIEAGTDLNIVVATSKAWSHTVVEEAESLGMVAICVSGILLFSFKPYFASKGWLGPAYTRDSGKSILHVTGQAEAFDRGSRLGGVQKSFSVGNLTKQGSNSSDELDTRTKKEERGSHSASLGAHISLIALTVFMSFGVSLFCHLVENEVSDKHHFLSGIRMFKLAMCCALFSMQLLLTKTKIRFHREWFMRLCGLMLDLLVISALAKSYPKPQAMETTHYIVCSCFVMICLVWHLFCFVFMAQSLFPNYWYERALTLSGDAMGHCYTGLLFARTLDPAMESPVPAAYAYKLMLFFIPSSGGKNTIIVSIISAHGPLAALIVSVLVVATWIIIFDTYFKHRFLLKDKSLLPSTENDDELDTEPLINNNLNEVHRQDVKVKEMSPMDGDYDPTDIKGNSLRTLAASAKSLKLPKEVSHWNVVTSEESSIASQAQLQQISRWLSEGHASKSWKLTYSLRQHGASLDALLALNTTRKTRSGITVSDPCIILIEDSWGYVFGGFVSPGFQSKSTYYGNGESFVFSLMPVPRVYKWTSVNELIVLSNEKCFAMGGGGDGFAIQLDDELDTGVSSRSDTFNNDTLSSNEFFKCLNVEVWSLELTGMTV